MISNLANKNNYDYTENQVNEIVGVLETEIRNLKTAEQLVEVEKQLIIQKEIDEAKKITDFYEIALSLGVI